MSEGALVESLGSAFGGEPAEKPDVPETPQAEAEVEALPEASAEPVEAEAADTEPEAEVSEPEFEIEVDGTREVVRGQERVKELLQKGLHYGKNSEINARVREQLALQVQLQQKSAQFQQQFMADLADLRAIDSQLEQWNRVDFGAAFESDPLNAMKLKEQRDSVREARAAKLQDIHQKQQMFERAQSQAQQQNVAVEMNALLAKLPEWRNSEKAQAEKVQLTSYLQGLGYTAPEIGQITDHRGIIMARKAMLYDQLQNGKAERLKQVRTAPPVVKPGAKVPANGKAEFQKVKATVKTLGQKGNHRAQEDLMTSILSRTFK